METGGLGIQGYSQNVLEASLCCMRPASNTRRQIDGQTDEHTHTHTPQTHLTYKFQVDIVAHTCSPSTPEGEAGGL